MKKGRQTVVGHTLSLTGNRNGTKLRFTIGIQNPKNRISKKGRGKWTDDSLTQLPAQQIKILNQCAVLLFEIAPLNQQNGAGRASPLSADDDSHPAAAPRRLAQRALRPYEGGGMSTRRCLWCRAVDSWDCGGLVVSCSSLVAFFR